MQPETKLRSRVGFEVSESGFRHEGYNFLYFFEKKTNSRESRFVSDLPFVPHFSFDLITFFLKSGKEYSKKECAMKKVTILHSF